MAKAKGKGRISYSIEDVEESYARNLAARNLAEWTQHTYLYAVTLLKRWLVEEGHPLDLEAVTRDQVQEFIIDQLGRVEATSVHTWFVALKLFWKWCVEEDLVAASPMLGLKNVSLGEKNRRVLSDDEILAMLKTCTSKSFTDQRDQALIRMFFDTGLRLTELTKIRMDALDLRGRTVQIFGKGRTVRTVAYGAKTATSLDRYLRARTHQREEEQALWLGQRGPLSSVTIRHVLRQRSKEAGLEHVHAHLFRHSFIDRLKRSDMRDEHIMSLTGHKNAQSFQLYAKHLRSERALEGYRSNAPGDKL